MNIDKQLELLRERHGPILYLGKWSLPEWESSDKTVYTWVDFPGWDSSSASFPPFNKTVNGKDFADTINNAWETSVRTHGEFKEETNK